MSLLNRIKKSENRPIDQQIAPSAVDLKGTGITKRVIERGQKAYARETEKSMHSTDQTALLEADSHFARAMKETLQALEAEANRDDITLDPSQLRALEGMLTNRFSVLIGAAGTGKTTLLKRFIALMMKHIRIVNLNDARFETITDANGALMRVKASSLQSAKIDEVPAIAGCAFTGRASQQFKRALPIDWQRTISTAHSLLGYAPTFEERMDPVTAKLKQIRIFRPSFNQLCKLPFTLYILDETSMFPIPLFNELIDAIPENSRIIFVGDINQLPPVYGKSVLGYAMRKYPVFELTEIHRQAAGNSIITNAHNVLNGRPLVEAKNFHMIGLSPNPSPLGQGDMKVYSLRVIKKLHEMDLYDPYRDAIIVPQNKGMIGQTELNDHLVTMFNGEKKEAGVIVNKRINIHTGTEHKFFAVGDKVMMNANINDTDPPITNGMLGVVEIINLNGRYDQKRSQVDLTGDDSDDEPIDLDLDSISFKLATESDNKEEKANETEDQRQSSHVMLIRFETGQTFQASTAGDYRKITYGYAFTCHKAQGGEYPNVIIICHSANAVMLSREWLYTAITRARQNVYLICNQRGLKLAIDRQVIKGKTLGEKIRSYTIETQSDDEMDVVDRLKHPMLPKNETLEFEFKQGD